MPKAPLRFSFRADANNYYYVDGNGNVQTSSSPVYVKSIIGNWKELQLQWNRHGTYLGVFRKQAPDEVQFVNNAAIILKYVYNTQGSEGVCQFVVDQLKTADLQYYNLGFWDVDFSKAKEHDTDFTCALMEAGLSALLNAYDTTNFEIPIIDSGPDADAIQVVMDGLNIQGDYNFIGVAFSNQNENSSSGTGQTNSIIPLPLGFSTQDGTLEVITPNAPVHSGVTVASGSLANEYLFKCLRPFSGKIKFNFSFFTQNQPGIFAIAGNVKVKMFVYPNGNFNTLPVNLANSIMWEYPNFSVGQIYNTGDIEFDYNFNTDDYVVICVTADTFEGLCLVEGGTLEVYYNAIYSTSLVSGYRHIQVLQKLTALLSQSVVNPPINANGVPVPVIYNAISAYLSDDVVAAQKLADNWDMIPWLTVFTCGDALRQLNTDTNGQPSWPTITTNFQDFYQDAFVRLMAGLGIEKDSSGQDVMVMELLTHFFQKDVLIADLGDQITDMEIAPYIDPLGNNMDIGYSDQTYDSVNGLYEPNCEQEMQLPITRVQKDLQQQSPYRADPFGIEFTRMNLTNKTTTDSSSDDDTFIVAINGGSVTPNQYNLLRAPAIINSGIPDETKPTMFNLPLTPHRNLYRNAAYWKSNLWGLKNQRINFQKASKNALLISQMYADEVIESSAFNVGDTNNFPNNIPLIWKPHTFTFKAMVPLNLTALMSANPYGVFGFTWKGKYREAFVLSAGINSGNKDSYSFKLLLSPNSDL